MPVPVWDSSDIALLGEPLDTVLSDDIWKKFDLEAPLPMYSHHNHERTSEDSMFFEQYSKESCLEEYQEIRHHDCMWAGLCISKEHNRTLPAKKDSQMHRKVPAGRSLLISRATPASSSQQQQHNKQKQHHRRTDNLESDGDSARSETPQSSSESDSESDCDVPMFKHDQISINDKLSECMTMVTKAAPVSEVTGQLVRNYHLRRKSESVEQPNHCKVGNRTNGNTDITKENEIRNTMMSDHCYHINQPSMKRLEDLGVQTPSDSEEEIDVVSFEKPSRPAALPTHPNSVDHQTFQLTVNTAFKEKPAPRPRGRPPSNANRKRAAQEEHRSVPAKRAATQRTCQKKTKTTKNTPPPPPPPIPISIVSPVKSVSSSRSSSDDEPDTDKRNLHNNMERQRRIELRNAFDDLRRLVPEIEAKEKAPKVAILRQAGKYCERLKEMEMEFCTAVTAEKERQEKLRAKLSFLRRTLAATR